MEVAVRPARPDDAAAGLLYESAAPYYDAYAGGTARARRLLHALYPRAGHTASWEVCRVAEHEGRVVGVLAAFATDAGDALATRFIRLTVLHSPPWRLPALLRHLRATSTISPQPPRDSLYVDALAVDAGARRRGVARRLLAEAEAMAREAGLSAVALDTGIENRAARALYEGSGFDARRLRSAADPRIARAVGGAGFVGYVKRLG
jgi:ribosomal protein S18 acetylase RimI-like enzyme